MTTKQVSKASIVKEHIAAQRWPEAIRLAASFPRLDKHRIAILDAHSAYTNPRFVVQIGKNVDALIEAGKAALIERFPVS